MAFLRLSPANHSEFSTLSVDASIGEGTAAIHEH